MKSILLSAALATSFGLANAHGYFETSKARQPGDAFQTACGAQAFSMMASDINGNIQGLEQLTANQADFDSSTCNLWQCKGMKFEDNTDNVQQYTAGQNIDLYFQIVAPHSGSANVSIVDTANNAIVSEPLQTWDEYALTSVPMEDGWQHFNVTMPSELGGKCATAGECVIQMHWNAPPPVDQTYQSCIDFTVGGGGSGSGSGGDGGSGSGSTGGSAPSNSTSDRCHARDFKY